MVAERKVGDFGSRLRAAREQRGVSLRQIAHNTKISIGVLEALERNDMSRLPGGIFSRAFVRSYAAEVGLDPEETVEDFVRQFQHESATAGSSSPPGNEVDSFESDQQAAATALKLVLLSVPIAGLALYLGMARGGGESRLPPVAEPASAIRHEPALSSAAQSAAVLSVGVVAERACTLSLALDGGPAVEVRLDASSRRTIEVQRELLLTVSDPDAVRITIDGVPVRSIGPGGRAATMRLTIDNYKDLLDLR